MKAQTRIIVSAELRHRSYPFLLRGMGVKWKMMFQRKVWRLANLLGPFVFAPGLMHLYDWFFGVLLGQIVMLNLSFTNICGFTDLTFSNIFFIIKSLLFLFKLLGSYILSLLMRNILKFLKGRWDCCELELLFPSCLTARYNSGKYKWLNPILWCPFLID